MRARAARRAETGAAITALSMTTLAVSGALFYGVRAYGRARRGKEAA